MMKCYFCKEETLMTVKDMKEKVFPCCKQCKDQHNVEKHTLFVHMIFFPKEEEVLNVL